MNNKKHVSREVFLEALEEAKSVNHLCSILKKSKPSIYTYASEYKIPLKGRWATGIRKTDGYYHYTNSKNHRMIMQEFLGRKLERSEHVHHIDGDKMNNELNNLIVMKWDDHSRAHKSLENIALQLFKEGIVVFNKESRLYELKKVKG